MTPQELISYIEGLIIDNTTQQISPYKMRSVLIEIVNSLNQSNISSLSAVLPLVYDPFTNVLSLPVVDNLTTGGSNAVLSAEQGKVLKSLIDSIVGGSIPTIQQVLIEGSSAEFTGDSGETLSYGFNGEVVRKAFKVWSVLENEDLSSDAVYYNFGLDRASVEYLRLTAGQEEGVLFEMGITNEGSSEGNTGIGNEGEYTNILITQSSNQDNTETAKYNLQFPTPVKSVAKPEVIVRFPQISESGIYDVAMKSDIPSSIILYPTTASSDISGYSKLVSDVNDADYNDTAVDVSTGSITGTSILISSLASAQGIFSGNITGVNITIVGNIKRVSGTANGTFYFEIYHRDSAGTETLIATSETTSEVSSSTYVEFSASALISNENFNSTDRKVYKFYCNKVGGGSNPTFNFQFGGASPVRILTPVSANLLLQPIYEELALKQDIIDPIVTKRYFEDFQGFGTGSAVNSIFFGTGTLEYEGNIFLLRGGTGATWARTSAEIGRAGIIRGGTGTTNVGNNLIQFRSIWLGSGNFLSQTSVRIQTLSDATNRFTLIFSNGVGVINSMRFFYSDNVNSGKWQCETYLSSVSTIVDSGVAVVANTWYDLKVCRLSGICYFYINNTLVATISTNIPSGIESFCGVTLTKTAGTTTRTCDFDYLKYYDL